MRSRLEFPSREKMTGWALTRWRALTRYSTVLQSSMLQRFTAESSRELSALRKLNKKQRQVSMFLILLFKLLTQFPFVSFLTISFLSLRPLPHPFFLFSSILCLPKIKTSNFITLCYTNGTFFCILFHTMTFFLKMHSISL